MNTNLQKRIKTSKYNIVYLSDSATVYTNERNDRNNGSLNIYKISVNDNLYGIFERCLNLNQIDLFNDEINILIDNLIKDKETVKFL